MHKYFFEFPQIYSIIVLGLKAWLEIETVAIKMEKRMIRWSPDAMWPYLFGNARLKTPWTTYYHSNIHTSPFPIQWLKYLCNYKINILQNHSKKKKKLFNFWVCNFTSKVQSGLIKPKFYTKSLIQEPNQRKKNKQLWFDYPISD